MAAVVAAAADNNVVTGGWFSSSPLPFRGTIDSAVSAAAVDPSAPLPPQTTPSSLEDATVQPDLENLPPGSYSS